MSRGAGWLAMQTVCGAKTVRRQVAAPAEIFNAHAKLFPIGIAYGNVNGKAEVGIADGSGMDELDPRLDTRLSLRPISSPR